MVSLALVGKVARRKPGVAIGRLLVPGRAGLHGSIRGREGGARAASTPIGGDSWAALGWVLLAFGVFAAGLLCANRGAGSEGGCRERRA